MSTDWNEPELRALLAELAETEEARDAIAEEHRQLEKDLLRLADPLPPRDFVQSVMRKVAAAPVRPLTRADVLSALAIVLTTTGAAGLGLVLGGDHATPGLWLADLAITLRQGLTAARSGLFALWATAALPLAASLSAAVFGSLFMLRRTMGREAAKVLP